MNIFDEIAKELNVKEWQVYATVNLIDEGNTIPFIARYRKEKTGQLTDDILRKLDERLKYLRDLNDQKEKAIKNIKEEGKLTPEMEKDINSAKTKAELEDIYRPFKKKKQTRASIAKEKGLLPLSNIIYLQKEKRDIKDVAKEYLSSEKEVNKVEDAISMAKDIIAENISDNPKYRKFIKTLIWDKSFLISKAKDEDDNSIYENYYDYSEPLKKAKGFKILALNRGEKEKFLKVELSIPYDEIISYLEKEIILKDNKNTSDILKDTIKDSFNRLIFPSVEREIKSELTKRAQDNAVDVFKKNLKGILMQPPILNMNVLGWDPGFKTGCKISVVDKTGKVLYTTVIYPTAPTNDAKIKAAKNKILDLIKKYNVDLISLGNGTASRESEKLIVEWIKETKRKVSYIITNEAGASVYSASEMGAKELPEYDVGERSAICMARRVIDPLAELVKIEPKSLGVGQYQHDIDEKELTNALDKTVEDCVNSVGVDLNTASYSLLEHISGITKAVAKNIVSYREKNGIFKNRNELLKVPKLGEKAFEQSAGFLRIRNGNEFLDSTGIHPESYEAARKVMHKIKSGLNKSDMRTNYKEIAKELNIGDLTLLDIINELEKPGRDPREELEKPILRSDVLTIEDLKEGMELKGTVRNVVDFGAFVDIGVHQDGLIHISQFTNKKYIKNPGEVVKVGDIVTVKIINIDKERKKISLSMIL